MKAIALGYIDYKNSNAKKHDKNITKKEQVKKRMSEKVLKGFYEKDAFGWTKLIGKRTIENNQIICIPENKLVPVVLVKDFLKEIEYWEKKTCPVKGVDEQVQGMLIEMKRRLKKSGDKK